MAREAPVPPTWPVLTALSLVAVSVLLMVGVDLFIARRVADHTAEIVNNSQRSIELVDDMRAQAHRLSRPNLTPERLSEVAQALDRDAVLYDPLASFEGERDEWNHLRGRLSDLEQAVRKAEPLGDLVVSVGESIDRLIVINRQQAHAMSEQIRDTHRKALYADAAAGAILLALVAAISISLVRLLRRQRQLVADHLQLLEERNRELDAFAGRAAHDLRSPLNPIRGYADLLMTGEEPPEEVKLMASRIRLAVDRMSRVVDDMLELSRAGRAPAGMTTLPPVAAQVLEELGPDLRGAEISSQLTDEAVRCSAGMMGQILRNLLTNAIKFRSRARPLTIGIKAVREQDMIALSVSDNGLGMDEQSAAHAFDPYRRTPETAREIPGHGLGLAIVERLVRAVGGNCGIQSTPDRGTEVTVRLPVA